MKTSKASGSEPSKKRKCIFDEEQQFLQKMYMERETEESFNNEDNNVREASEPTPRPGVTTEEKAAKKGVPKAKRLKKQHEKLDDVDTKILEIIKKEKDNNKLTFFKSLLQHVDKFDDYQWLQCQMEFFQVILKVRNAHPPYIFDAVPSAKGSGECWSHWYRVFENFVAAESLDKLSLLRSHVSPRVLEYFSHCSSYADALQVLKDLYEKPVNEVLARHKLLSCKQKEFQSLEKYLNTLKELSKNCNFKAADVFNIQSDYIRDVFISGVSSSFIRQRLLENQSLSLEVTYDQAVNFEMTELQTHSNQIYQSTASGLMNLLNCVTEKSTQEGNCVSSSTYFLIF